MAAARSSLDPPSPVIIENLRLHRSYVGCSGLLGPAVLASESMAMQKEELAVAEVAVGTKVRARRVTSIETLTP